MNGADLAAIICSVALSVLVLGSLWILTKVAKFLDTASATIRETGDTLIPLLTELTETTKSTNKQLAKIDVITDNVVDATTNLTSLINTFTATIGGPLLRVGEIVKGVTGLIGKKKK